MVFLTLKKYWTLEVVAFNVKFQIVFIIIYVDFISLHLVAVKNGAFRCVQIFL